MTFLSHFSVNLLNIVQRNQSGKFSFTGFKDVLHILIEDVRMALLNVLSIDRDGA